MKKYKGSQGGALIALMVSAGCGMAQTQAFAQEGAYSDVIVTGTRQRGMSAADSPAPIQLVGSEAFEKVGQPDLTQGLQQNLPSFTAQTFGGDTGNFTLSAALRGLNPNHTLVLVNGKRRHPSANFHVSPGGRALSGCSIGGS
ncbi:MAG: Plug domain-containing protein [Sphingobium sp.]|nr:Plug domain-containing protein [Sphingobium sp.]